MSLQAVKEQWPEKEAPVQQAEKAMGLSDVGHYLVSRFTTLKPPMDKIINPVTALRMLNSQQWLFFACAFCGWTLDSFDFFTVSLTLTPLAKQFDKSNSQMTWGISLVLMVRPAGAILFGIWSDRWGRKWPFVFNCLLFSVLELGTGFCQTYKQFLAVRALFGIAMGGLYGNAVATALEDCPDAARGILSGMFQSGYSMGYLLATAFARALVDTTRHGWRPLFWFSACPPVLLIAWRLCLPETQAFRQRQMQRRSASPSEKKGFWKTAKDVGKNYWLIFIFMVVLAAGCNYMSHGSQDLYPTMLVNQFQFSQDRMTVTQIIANLGGMLGGVCMGNLSEILGRRLTIIGACVLVGALLYPYTFVSSPAVAASAFFMQFAVQGAFGVVPSHLMELSPPCMRSFIVGTAYQLGSLAASPAATIQSSLGEKKFPLAPAPDGTKRYKYGLVVCAVLGIAAGLVLVTTFLGPENKGQRFGDGERDDDSSQTRRQTVPLSIKTDSTLERDEGL